MDLLVFGGGAHTVCVLVVPTQTHAGQAWLSREVAPQESRFRRPPLDDKSPLRIELGPRFASTSQARIAEDTCNRLGNEKLRGIDHGRGRRPHVVLATPVADAAGRLALQVGAVRWQLNGDTLTCAACWYWQHPVRTRPGPWTAVNPDNFVIFRAAGCSGIRAHWVAGG